MPAGPVDLVISNGLSGDCGINDTIVGQTFGTYDLCGGELIYTWDYTDPCGTPFNYQQVVTINEVIEADWVDAPPDVTVSCDSIPTSHPSLDYTNGYMAGCEISGTAPPTTTGSADLCGGDITNVWTFTDDCGRTKTHTQVISATPVDEAVFDTLPPSMTITCDEIPVALFDLTYDNGESGACQISGTAIPTQTGSADLCGGVITYDWEFTDACGRTTTHTQVLTVTAVAEATFDTLPPSMTITCDEIPTALFDLNYDNGESGACQISGTVTPTQTGSADLCGGVITYEWTFTDVCGRTTTHTQVLTVNPVVEATFDTLPPSMTITCDEIPTALFDLNYDNGESGACQISGTVTPTQTGSADLCGGVITYEWAFTDVCGRTTTHTQVLTVTAVPEATFDSLPASMTITCDEIPTALFDLNYDNGESGACQISGTVTPTQTGSADLCGGVITYEWAFTDVCGRPTTHTQVLTVTAVPPAVYDTLPPSMTVDCADIPTSAPTLNYDNGESGACAITGSVPPVTTGMADLCGGEITNTWEFTDVCGRVISHVQVITVTPVPEAVLDTLPASMTITCAEIPTTPLSIDYSNGLTGACLISGTVVPDVTGSADLCGGAITYTWTFTDPCGRATTHTQTLTVTPVPLATYDTLPPSMTVDCADIPTTAPTLNYDNGESGACAISGSVSPVTTGSADLCGGAITNTWEFTDVCGRTITHVQVITVTPVPEAVLDSMPASMTITCAEIPTTPLDIDYTNGLTGACLISGTVSPTVTGSADLCGGTITNTWTFTDVCNRTTTHVQTLTVTPVPIAVFDSLPPSMTVDCADIPTSAPALNYDNGESGACAIMGSVPAVTTGSADLCGGTITNTWEFTDVCGRPISHVQTINVTPVPEADFDTLPPSLTITCAEIPTSAPNLNFTNGLAGACEISGSVTPSITGSADLCGGTITNTWSFTDACGRTKTHVQTLTVTPVPEADWVDPPPASITVDCYNIPTSAPPLEFTNNLMGSCEIAGAATPSMTGSANECGGTITFTWSFTDACNRTKTHVQTVTVTPTPPAAWVDPPPSIVVDCYNIPTGPPDLEYSNGETGNCGITGTVPGTQTGSANLCGGVIQYAWTFTDQCGRNIQYFQTITVTPTPKAQFVNPPPALEVIECEEIPASAPNLQYTNNESGSCEISGTIAPVQTGSAGKCGGTINYTWTFTDQCGRITQHVQTLIVNPAPEGDFQNPPASITVDCANIPASAPALTFTNGLGGTCGIFSSVPAQLVGTPSPCGSQYSYQWQFTDACGRTKTHTQFITVTPTPEATFTNPPLDITVTCDQVSSNLPALQYTNNESGNCAITGSVQGLQTGMYDYCGGVLFNDWEFTDNCGRTIAHTQTVTVLPSPAAVFQNLPVDITVTCDNIPGPNQALNYSNGQSGACAIQGSILPSESGSWDACGGYKVFEWFFEDNCGRTIQHSQNVTILKGPDPVFVGPPMDVTISCSEADLLDPSIETFYSNYGSGDCENQGTVTAFQDATYNECGGTILYTWELDACGTIITHTQVITVEPVADPIFEGGPPDLTLECGEPLPALDELYYFNNESGICEIEGFVPPEVTEVDHVWTVTWEYTNPCTGNVITEKQVILEKPDPIMQVDPDTVRICLGDNFDLSTLQVVDVNNAKPSITYHTGTPATAANQLTNSVVNPIVTTVYYIKGTTVFGCIGEVPFTLIVDQPVTAGGNGGGYLCNGAANVNFFTYINGNYTPGGTWVDPNNSGIDIFPPTDVSFAGFPPGVYTFNYVVPNNGACIGDTSTIALSYVAPINILIDSLVCESSQDFYNVYFTLNTFVPTASIGTLADLGNGTYSVSAIPVDSSLTIIGTDPASGCFAVVVIDPPNCNCPPVPNPVNLGNPVICQGDPIPTLQVTVGPGDIANWYTAPNGGTLLQANSTSYTPAVSNPGVYIYYVEAVNAMFPNCKSTQRTPVELTIQQKPTVVNGILKSCDANSDGFASFTLSNANTQVNGNPNNTFVYYLTAADAQNGVNPLPNNYTNTVPNQQTIHVMVTNQAGCKSPAEVTLIVFPTIQLMANVTGETCLGDANGSVIISSTGGTGQVQYSLMNSSYSAQTNYTNLTAGAHTAWARDTFNCTVSLPFTIPDGLELTLDPFTVVCNNNNTPSDATDDFYTITFTVSNNQVNAGTYNVTGPGVNQGPFTYGQSHNFTLPANGQSLTLTFTDAVKGCPITQQIGPLNSCSTDCLITITTLTKVCNDAGTNSDPADDFYEFTVNATAVNGGPSNSFVVVIGGTTFGPFTYGTGGTFTLPADGSNPVVTFIDNDDAQCSASQSAGALTPCSNTCLITAVVDSIKCDGLGTENDIFDDVFTFQVTVSGLNKSTSWYVDPNSGTTYPYDVAQTFGPYLISNGVVVLTLVDSADPNCTVVIQVTPPPPCSEPCELVVVNLNQGPCNDNNTGPNVDDDFFPVSFTVNAVLGTTSQYEVTWNGMTWGPFNYGVNVNLPNVPANGQNITLLITDINNPACVTSVDVMQDPCSECNQTAEAGPNFELGCLTPDVILQGSANPPNGTYAWTGPNNFMSAIPTPIVSFPGTYILTVTYADQCVAIDSAIVTVDQSIPVADAGADGVLTCVVDTIILGGNGTSLGPDFIYIWKDGAGNQIGNTPTLVITQPGTYTLQVINFTNNCSSPIDQVVVTLDQEIPMTPIYSDPAPALGCLVDTVTLSTDPQVGVVFTWTQGGTVVNGLTYELTTPGLVTLTAVDTTNGCSGASQITINDETDIPLVNNGVLKSCDPDGDGLATFDLTSANNQINPDPTNTFTYHLTLADAQTGANALPASYTTVTPGQQVIYVRVANAIGCFDVATLTLIVYPPIVLQTNVTGETCLGDANGSVTLSSTGGTGQVQYSLMNSNFTAQTVYGSLPAGAHTAWARDTFGCTVSKPFTVPVGLDLNLDNFEVVCDNNGTLADATDDFYVITFNVSNSQANAGTFNVTGTGVNEGPFTYGVTHSFTIPANGQTLTLNLADVVKGCSLSEQIGPLNSCSTNCLLTITTLTKVCDDNGTDYDPADDFYTFTVNATALNPGASGTFNVIISGNTYGPYMYGVGGTFTIPANGTNPVVTFRDADDNQCSASQSAGALIPCSDKCLLNALVTNIVCDKNGTDNDPLDDTYDFELTVTGFNNSAEWYVDPNATTTYPYGALQNFGPYLISNGNLVLTLVDLADPSCTVEVTVTAPPPCSEPCEVELVNLNVGPCNNNNTGPITTDDYFDVSFVVNAILGNTSTYEVTGGGMTWGPFTYGTLAVLNNIPANGQIITLTILDLNNPNCSTTINVSQDPCSECNQTVEAGPGFTLDCTIQTATLNGSANPAGGALLWSGPNAFSSTIANPVVSFPGTYVLTVTYPDQCTAADSTVVDIDASVPQSNAGPNKVLTCLIDSVYLDGSLSSTGPNFQYIWKDPSGQVISNGPGLWVTLPGNYTLQIINTDNNCSSLIDVVSVTENKQNPVAPIMADPGELLNCVIDNVLLFTDPQPNITFTWTVGSTKIDGLQTIVSQPGVVILTATNTITGCVGVSQIIIEDQTEYPIVTVQPPGSLNCVETEVTIDASTSQSGPNIIFTWYDENGVEVQSGSNKFLTVTDAGDYFLEVADTSNGCSNRDTVTVITDVDYPLVEAGPEIKLPCDIYTANLSAVGSNYGTTAVISWSSAQGAVLSGANTFTPQVEGTGWYFIDLTNGENGCASRDSVFVKGNADAPDPDIEVDPIACKGDNDGAILVGNIQNGTPPYTIQLNGEVDNSGQFTPLGPGTYNLQITDSKNCKFDTTIVIVEGNDLFLSLSANSILIVEGDSAVLEAIVNIPASEIGAVVWSPGTFLSCDSCLITKVVPLNTQEYKVTVTDLGGCSAVDYIIVVVKKDTKVYIPNAFSPDGDIINDNFTLYGDDKVKRIISMKIFDRWGGLMFQGDDIPPNDPQYGWDGTTKGQPVELGVYVYMFIVEFTDGRQEVFSGDVTVTKKLAP